MLMALPVDTIKVVLPAKPVNGFKIVFFRMYMGETWYTIHRNTATYYNKAKYSEVCDDPYRGSGLDLVDQWWITEGGRGMCRWCGWRSPVDRGYLEGNAYASLEDAVAAIDYKMMEYINNHNRLAVEITQARDKLAVDYPLKGVSK